MTPRELLDALTGHTVPGGCDTCQAEQTITDQGAGVYVCTIHHEDTCPTYRTHAHP